MKFFIIVQSTDDIHDDDCDECKNRFAGFEVTFAVFHVVKVTGLFVRRNVYF